RRAPGLVPSDRRDAALVEAKAGVSFPHARYAQVLTTGNAAQELASHALIGRIFLDPILETPEEDWVIAHELAHQWWGNLVTCESWSEFWLNEGVTTYMVAAWKEHRWGRAAYDREMEIARRGRERAAAAGFDKPLSWPGDYPSLGFRRAVQYSKGALFMDALRGQLGDAAFWAGLKRFTRTHAGGTVNSRDFQRAFEAESGRNLQPLFDQWVF
ncbi:MAG: M1 family peptidase, partial [Proteobacteria bacterium]|nr:M1 family peptidase [Pseudomonadota bacterium]